MNFVYPSIFTPDKIEGGFWVRFLDFPEAITQGETIEETIIEARDCLEEAIAGRIVRGDEIPAPSKCGRGTQPIFLPALLATKTALYLAIRKAPIKKVELARRMGCDEKEIRRLLDPRHPSKLQRIEAALAILGKRIIIEYLEVA